MSTAVAVWGFDRRRWWLCFAVIAVLHAAGVWLVVHWRIAEPPASPPVVMTIDLAPLAAARPRPPITARSRPKPVARARPPEPATPAVVPRAPAPRVVVSRSRQMKPNAPESPALPQPPPAHPDAELPPPVSPPQVSPAQVSPPQIAAAPAPEAAATAPSAVTAAPSSNAVPTWQGLLLGRLEKFKRYPSSAQLRRQQGVAYLRFAMDRRGHVVSAVIDKSSGFATLDAEALALVYRAEPLPSPPPEVPGDPIELVVPIEFFLKPAP